MTKAIFLDIDGVLSCRKEWAKPFLDDRCHDFSIVSTSFLNHIIEKTNADIIISSTWRFGKTIDQLQALFAKRGFRFSSNIKGMTEKSFGDLSRGQEIDNYLRKNPYNKYVIIDDDSDMLEHQFQFFVKTNTETGLELKHVEKVLRLLSKGICSNE